MFWREQNAIMQILQNSVTTAVPFGPSAVTVPAPVPQITTPETSGGAAATVDPSPVPAGGKPLADGPTLFATQDQSQDGTDAGEGEEDDLSPEDQETVEKLKARDREVREHEQAHVRAGQPYAGSPSYDYQTGPDGKQYAVGGEVPIDVSPVPNDPQATIEKMAVVKKAALAPKEPSSQDRSVAAKADAQRLQAQAELNAQDPEDEEAALDPVKAEPPDIPDPKGPKPPMGEEANSSVSIQSESDAKAEKKGDADTIQVQIDTESTRRFTGGAAVGNTALLAYATRAYAGAVGGTS